MTQKKKKFSLGTYTILAIVLLIVAALSWIFAGQPYIDADGNNATITGATLADIVMAPIKGFHDSGDVMVFVFCFGGFLAVLNASEALKTGIYALVRKLKGKELWMIPILMFVFSIGGTTFGMGEETVGFYIILAATMMAAGMDPIVGAAIVLLGAGTGVLGSTINPFATGVAIAVSNQQVNMGIVYAIALILWFGTFAISAWYTMRYGKKLLEGKGSILSAGELEECAKAYDQVGEIPENISLNKKQKVSLIVFALAFSVMIMGFIPWEELAPNFFNSLQFTGFLTGNPFGWWWFDDAAIWFILIAVVLGLYVVEDKKDLAPIIISGIGDLVAVNLVITMARASSVLLTQTGLGYWIVEASISALTNSGVSAGIFAFGDYVLHVLLSFFIPSSSGLAAISSPIVSPIVAGMNWSVESAVMILVAANGLVNLVTPTCAFIVGGLALAKIPYTTWVKWAKNLLLILFVFCAVVLTLAMIILS